MSETKRTPSEVLKDISPQLSDGLRQYVEGAVAARPKVEELVAAVNKLKGHLEETGEYRICRADKEQMGLPDQMTIGQVLSDLEDKAREVEAALGGKGVDLEAHERDLERQSGCGKP